MNIAMISSEALPFSKSGGLADVVYSLSKALKGLRQNVAIIVPFYQASLAKGIDAEKVAEFDVRMSWRDQRTTLYKAEADGILYYLVANDYYFRRERMYGYMDDGERFAFFALAASEALRHLEWKPDVVHVHDWQSAIVPTLVSENYYNDDAYKGIRFVLTIHNPAFKGMLDRYFLTDFFNLPDHLFDIGKVRFEGMFSTLKSGIVYSDLITTVSPTHREELLTRDGGQGLDGVLEYRRDDFVGILNGIDYGEWNPEKDTRIAKTYGKETLEEGKHLNQSDLLKAYGLHWYGGPVYGIVSRLTWQKGIDILLPEARSILSKGGNFVLLGSGEYELEQRFEELRSQYPDTCGIYIGYNDALAHKIYAGSDFFMMPSLFEPCGLSQMISQRYGTLPIVRMTGGLADTVHPYDGMITGNEDGLAFRDYNVEGLDYAVYRAEELYRNQEGYYKVARAAMGRDHSWRTSARGYLAEYKKLLARK